MKLTLAFAVLVALAVCGVTHAQTDAAKDAADKVKDKAPAVPDAPKLDKDAAPTTPDPKEATKKLEDAAGKAKDQGADIGKKLTEGFKL
ncbi:uncharacterized protein LOC126574194 [Anopheles aquasalis]|uniref:uncharacterized protein LOC126574194 n=1 Tax=Anopheles aquasalis TaxID=42839 RepID=UPI00215A83E8|nr:uncharacterized protein LOC126574194 [Anopheles aquasalis]